jgi:pimeloyl-ACP methyl ester carboxylesterase
MHTKPILSALAPLEHHNRTGRLRRLSQRRCTKPIDHNCLGDNGHTTRCRRGRDDHHRIVDNRRTAWIRRGPDDHPSRANNVEHLDAPTAFAEVATIESLTDVPMVVATADHHSYAGLAPSEEARLNDVWNAEQAHWVSPVSSAQLISVENTSHYFQLDRPDVALDMIHDCSNESSK